MTKLSFQSEEPTGWIPARSVSLLLSILGTCTDEDQEQQPRERQTLDLLPLTKHG